MASQEGFQFPAFYNIPPFFTLQPHAGVRAKQLALWKQLAHDYCSYHRLYSLDVTDARRSELFCNVRLQRQLTAEGLRAVAEHLVSEGAAAWANDAEGGPKARLLVFWRSPAEWARLVLQWAEDMGRIGSIETVTSLCEGEATESQAFHGVPREIMMVALHELVRRGRASIFRGKATNQEGVKFLPA
mmetsp:Transcript_35683/g.82935  ORF Transcript_35683/g.82935 Transcript_35683/m.82935 type:complete len:187 (-) Transcript_35683:113-673(-)